MRPTGRVSPHLRSIPVIGLAVGAVLVAGPVVGATLSPDPLTLAAGATAWRDVTAISGRATVVTSNKGVATATLAVSSGDATRGVVTVHGIASGTATISVKDGIRKTVSFTVSVTAPDALSARLMAANCFQCHGPNGAGGFKSLAQMTAGGIYNQLLRYKGSTSTSNIMAAHASGYTDAQLKQIADHIYFLNH